MESEHREERSRQRLLRSRRDSPRLVERIHYFLRAGGQRSSASDRLSCRRKANGDARQSRPMDRPFQERAPHGTTLPPCRSIESLCWVLARWACLAATFLHEAGFEVTALDVREPKHPGCFPVRTANLADRATLHDELAERPGRVVVPAVPPQPPGRRDRPRAGHPLLRSHRGRRHHADDRRAQRRHRRLMAPQCGLAPGFVAHRRLRRRSSRSTAAVRSACASALSPSTRPACSATRSTGRPRAW